VVRTFLEKLYTPGLKTNFGVKYSTVRVLRFFKAVLLSVWFIWNVTVLPK
jgi:hypothetical protein